MPTSRKGGLIAAPDEPTHASRAPHTFDGPRAAGIDAWTEPGSVERWLGPRNMDVVAYPDQPAHQRLSSRFIQRTPDGRDFSGSQHLHENLAGRPYRSAHIILPSCSGMPSRWIGWCLEEHDGRFRYHNHRRRPARRSRTYATASLGNGAIEVGMNEAARASTSFLPNIARAA